MKTKLLLAAGLAAVTFAGVGAHKAMAITTSGNIEANILAAITLTAVDTLDFGRIAPGTIDTVVYVAATTGARSITAGDGTLVAGGGEQDGTFNLDGSDGLTVTITVPADGAITVANGLDTLEVDSFEWSYDGGATTVGNGTAVLAVGGPDILSIGAELTVEPTDPAGTYTGTFPVTVDYQ